MLSLKQFVYFCSSTIILMIHYFINIKMYNYSGRKLFECWIW